MHMISQEIWKSSKDFDIDTSANATNSKFDKMVDDNVLKKAFDNDNLLIIEGEPLENPDFPLKLDLLEEI